MTKIYLIRHAEAEGNYYRRIHGQYDSRVTSRGYRQIEALAERFKDVHLDAVYSSDLFRTMTTAGAITKYHPQLTIVPDERLREINMGCWEDVPFGNTFYHEPESMWYFANDPEHFHVEGSEDYNKLQERIVSEVLSISARHDGQTIAVVSHGTAIRSLLCHAFGVPSDEITRILHGDNTCVALVTESGGQLQVEYYNDNTHLGNELSTFANQTWWKNHNSVDYSNLRIEPMDPEQDAKLYAQCYADSWKAAHGSLIGFAETPYLEYAKRVSQRNTDFLVKVFYGEEFAGIVELDPELMSYLGSGWLSFCYLVPEYRGKGYGAQLVGHAISVFRRMERKNLRLHVAQTNTNAIAFYEKLGFKHISTDKGAICPLLLMELPL